MLIYKYTIIENHMQQTHTPKKSIATTYEQLVWYVCYGSNVSQQRFGYYIHGGTMPMNNKTYVGCRDKTSPRGVKNIELRHELYFAQHSSVWGGGVAFIEEQESVNNTTHGRAYLITLEQFVDVVQQENGLKKDIQLPLQEHMNYGKIVFREFGLYSEILYLGDIDGVPSLTFTTERHIKSAKPSSSYLRQIATGLREDYDMTYREVAQYLESKPGVRGSYSVTDLTELQLIR